MREVLITSSRIIPAMCPLSSVTGLFHTAERRAERGQRCALLLYGQSGVGKTTLLRNQLLNNDRLVVGMGKAEQFGGVFPYRPVLDAIRQATSNWLERAEPSLVEELKSRVRGLEDVLSILVPEIAHWAPSGMSAVLTPEQNRRIMLAIRRLLSGLCSGPRPLVLIIDDLQWLDSETIQRLILGLDYTELRGLLLVFSCHSDSGAALERARNLMTSLANLGFATNELEIGTTITEYWIRQLSEQTGQSEERLTDIARAVGESTQTSLLFLRYAADFLQAGGELEQLLPEEDALGLFQLRLSQFQPQEREALGLIACAGRVSPSVLAHAASRSTSDLDVESLLLRAETSGIVARNPKDGTLSIAHDNLQEVCAGSPATWPARSLNLLDAKLAECGNLEEQSDEDLFWLIDHVLKASPLLKLHGLREQAVRIALVGSARARSRAAVDLALKACRVAQRLLLDTDDPLIQGKVFREYAVACWISGNIESFNFLASEAEKALSPLDLVPITELRLQGAISRAEHAETVELALSASRELLPHLPEIRESTYLNIGHDQVSELLERLRRTSPSDDSVIQAVSRLLTTANAAAYVGTPDRLPTLVALQLKLTEKYGATEWLPVTLAYWSALLTGRLESLEVAFEIGQLALSLATQNRNGRVEARVRDLVFGMVLCWHGDLRWSIAPLKANKELALQHGTFEFAGYSLLKNIAYRLYTGDNLATLERDLTSALIEFEALQQPRMCLYLEKDLATVRQLRSPSVDPADLNDGRFKLEPMLELLESGNDRYGLLYTMVNRLLVATVYEDDKLALRLAEQAEALRDGGPGLAHQGMVSWLGGLAVLSGHGPLSEATAQNVSKSIRQLDFWSRYAPTTWESRSLQLKAELARRQGEIELAETLFDQALKKAEESNYLLDQCIVCLKRAELTPNARAKWRNKAFLALQSWRDSDSDSWFTSRSREESLLRDVVRVTNSRSQTELANALVDLVRLQFRVKHVNLIAKTGPQMSAWNPLPEINLELVREAIKTGKSSLVCHADNAECCLPVLLDGEVHSVLYAIGALSSEDRDGSVLFASLECVVELAEAMFRTLGMGMRLGLTESESADREAFFTTLVNESGAALFARDKSGRVLLANRSYAEAVGCSTEELLGRRVDDVLPEEVSGRLLKNDEIVLRTGQNKESLETFTNVDGEIRSYATVRAPLRDRTGQIVGVCGTSSDITAIRRAEEESQRGDRLIQLGTFAGKIAHDLRNMVNAILGNLELIKLDIEPNSPLLESLNDIEITTNRATELVAGILKFCQQPPPAKQYFPVCALLEEAGELVRIKLKSGIPITVAAERRDLELYADPNQIHQVAMNLISNAVQACSRRDGKVEILVRRLSPEEEFEVAEAVEITVRDNGKGMDETTARKAFDAFFTTKPYGVGSGLGLSIVKGIVRAHNGRISVDSQPGRGTVITLRLPNQTTDYEGLIIG